MSSLPATSLDTMLPDRRLDDDALARLRELDPDGRHGVVARVLGAFEASLQRQRQLLRDPAFAADVASVAGVAHMLKSSAASCGARELATLCAGVEARLRDDSARPPGPDADRIAAAITVALGAVAVALGR